MIESAWNDRRWVALPPLRGVQRADVCVVGLGGSGLSAIHALLDHELTVIGIDAGSVAGGAAGANGGFLLAGTPSFYHRAVESFGEARAQEIYRLTVDEIASMERRMPDIVRRVGSLRIAHDDAELEDCERQLRAMQDGGLNVERYAGPEGQGLLFPGDGVFNPLARCRRLAQEALQAGARLYEGSPALTIETGAITCELGKVFCGHVIVAVDGRLELIFPGLEGRVRTARLQMLGTAPTDEVRISRPVYARYGYEYWQQLPDGRVVLGGFRDRVAEEEWTHSTDSSQAVQSLLTEFLRDHIGVRAEITHRWAASVGYTSTGLPIAEEMRKNVWAIGGYCGTGNVIGALGGKAVADRIAGSNVADILRLF